MYVRGLYEKQIAWTGFEVSMSIRLVGSKECTRFDRASFEKLRVQRFEYLDALPPNEDRD